MTKNSSRDLLKAFKNSLSNDLDKSLVDAYLKNFNYDDLERAFRQQLAEVAEEEDET